MWIRSSTKAERDQAVTLLVDDHPVQGYAGEMLAVALRAAGVTAFRRSPRDDAPRGPFCLMGVCQECLVWVDGRRALACREVVRAGMTVATGNVRPGTETCSS